MIETKPEPNRIRSSSFIPFLLLAISLIAVLAWQLWVGNEARANGQRLREQQLRMVDESKRLQQGLESLARDLVNVSQSDNDARAIVTRYGISLKQPSPASTTPAPAANPAPSASP